MLTQWREAWRRKLESMRTEGLRSLLAVRDATCDGCAEKAQAESPVRLDEEGLPAITGSRYRRSGDDEWDLCQECFQGLSTEEQRNYRHCAPAATWAGGSGDGATTEAVPPTRCRDEEEGEEVPASRDMGRQQEMWQPAPAPVQILVPNVARKLAASPAGQGRPNRLINVCRLNSSRANDMCKARP